MEIEIKGKSARNKFPILMLRNPVKLSLSFMHNFSKHPLNIQEYCFRRMRKS